MYRHEVVDLLNAIDKKRPKLFPLDTDFPKVIDQWQSSLGKFTKAEVDELMENGFYIRRQKPNVVLQELVSELEEQRYEKSGEGQAYLQSLIDEYYARHPHTEKVAEKEELSYESYHWGILIGDEWHLVDDTTLPLGREKPCRDNGRI